MVQGQPGENSLRDLISKVTRAKWTGGVTQLIEHRLCKHEAMSSNLSLRNNGFKISDRH
jgi:hypothetical protein